MSSTRSHWSSRLGFVLATAGSAVGLGNIWKFPYMAGANGGSAFVLVYLACVVVLGLPLLMAETLLGRRAQSNPVEGMGKLAAEAGASPRWRWVGLMGLATGAMILSFYSVVAGWMLDYLLRGARGEFTGMGADQAVAAFGSLLASPVELVAYHSLFIGLTTAIAAAGVVAGLERANRIMMPGLVVILLLLLAYGAVKGDMAGALHFMFNPDFSKLTPQVLLAALGQAFFSLSLGMGAVMVYGSYLSADAPIPRLAVMVALADTGVAILAGLAVVSVVLATGLEPGAGPGLVMQTLPIAFGQLPGGQVIAPLFFLLVVFAALTSSISLLEPALAWATETLGMRRGAACVALGLTVWLLGVAAALSFNVAADWKLFGRNFFDLMDYATSNVLLPLGGVAIAIFAGWVMHGAHSRAELALPPLVHGAWRLVVRYLAPIAITLVFLNLTGVLPG